MRPPESLNKLTAYVWLQLQQFLSSRLERKDDYEKLHEDYQLKLF